MNDWGEQLGLFGANGFPQPSPSVVSEMEQLAVRIARSCGLKVSTVRWKNNHRVMASIGKNSVLNLHRIYQRATEADFRALAKVLSGKAGAGDHLKFNTFIERHLPRELGSGKSRLIINPARGLFHDLEGILARLVPLLDGPLDPEPKLGWSPARVGKRGITWGTHRDMPEGSLILVNAVLDAPDIPNFVIEHIVWHEICHQAAPPEKEENGRRKIHGESFKEMEERYPRIREAERWEQDQVSRLIRRHRR